VKNTVVQQGKMTFVRGLHNLQPGKQKSVVTIGSFDGVHIGHQAILQQVKDAAERLQLPSVVMTFEPQPREYFSSEQAPARLMRLREKIDALLDFGIDHVVCLKFNRQLRNLSALDFIDRVLVQGLAVEHLIVGDDFRFGCDRSGDFAMLTERGVQAGFEVMDTATVEIEGQRVSSTLVREFVERGDFHRAAELLGRPFSISGVVGYGQQLGRELGFPTANVQLNRFSAPLSGVFAVRVDVAGTTYQGAANVGVRPTVGDLLKPILEVHLLDFDGDLYGQRIAVEFIHKIRDEQKFTGLEELIATIQGDVEVIRQWFTNNI
jgi:riboflavin kinase/FMN adenylyltransferase